MEEIRTSRKRKLAQSGRLSRSSSPQASSRQRLSDARPTVLTTLPDFVSCDALSCAPPLQHALSGSTAALPAVLPTMTASAIPCTDESCDQPPCDIDHSPCNDAFAAASTAVPTSCTFPTSSSVDLYSDAWRFLGGGSMSSSNPAHSPWNLVVGQPCADDRCIVEPMAADDARPRESPIVSGSSSTKNVSRNGRNGFATSITNSAGFLAPTCEGTLQTCVSFCDAWTLPAFNIPPPPGLSPFSMAAFPASAGQPTTTAMVRDGPDMAASAGADESSPTSSQRFSSSPPAESDGTPDTGSVLSAGGTCTVCDGTNETTLSTSMAPSAWPGHREEKIGEPGVESGNDGRIYSSLQELLDCCCCADAMLCHSCASFAQATVQPTPSTSATSSIGESSCAVCDSSGRACGDGVGNHASQTTLATTEAGNGQHSSPAISEAPTLRQIASTDGKSRSQSEPQTFSCHWSACRATFDSMEALIGHVNAQHLWSSSTSVPTQGWPVSQSVGSQGQARAQAGTLRAAVDVSSAGAPTMANVNVCQWDDCGDPFAGLNHLLTQHLGHLGAGADGGEGSLASVLNTSFHPSAAAVSSDGAARSSSLSKVGARAPYAAPAAGSTTDATERHQCRWRGCSLVFSTSANLTEHVSEDHVGHGKAWYECWWEGCDRHGKGRRDEDGEKGEEGEGGAKKKGKGGFAQRQKVMRHIMAHTGDRPHRCPHPGCDKRFAEPNTLAQHLRTHTNERPYVCDHPGCGKAFAIAGALTIHKRVHSGDKPFICRRPGCGKAFSESSNLTKHMRTHTGERPFACPHPGCEKRFSRPDQVSRHLKTHGGPPLAEAQGRGRGRGLGQARGQDQGQRQRGRTDSVSMSSSSSSIPSATAAGLLSASTSVDPAVVF